MLPTMSAEEFAEALATSKGLVPPPSAEGIVRKSDDPKVIELSPSSPAFPRCSLWIRIPVEIIDRVLLLGKRACGDHVHDYVVLYFKRPSGVEARVYAQLLHVQGSNEPVAAEKLADSLPRFQAFCAQPHGVSGPWYGPCQSTFEAARQDQATHFKSFGGFHWGGVNWHCN
jgi:hypothetical protein